MAFTRLAGAFQNMTSWGRLGRALSVRAIHGTASWRGGALAAIGVLAIWFPWLLPGLHVSGMPAMSAT